MNDLMLSAAYQSLGRLLAELTEDSAVKSDPGLSRRVGDAVSFHAILREEFRGVLEENEEMRRRLHSLTREPGEIVCDSRAEPDMGKYQKMKDEGASPADVYTAAERDGLGMVVSLRVLRQLFNLSLDEAKALSGT
jgi:hypothetical protein